MGVLAQHPEAVLAYSRSARIDNDNRIICEDQDGLARDGSDLADVRAVRRYVEEVAAQTPYDVLVKLVEQRVGALEPAGALQIGVADHRADPVGSKFSWPAVHFGVAEAMDGEARLPGFRSATPQRVAIRSLGGPQRAHAQLAVLQHLGMAQRDGGALLTLHCDPQATNDVLAEVNQCAAG